jgi:hypothetical protein
MASEAKRPQPRCKYGPGSNNRVAPEFLTVTPASFDWARVWTLR